MKIKTTAFRNNYPAAILILIILISSFTGSAQTLDGKFYQPIVPPYSWQSGWFKTNLNIPKSAATTGRDTGAIYYKLSDSSMYVWTGSQWVPISGMTYPGAGIPLSTGSAWNTSITNNSANWNTAYGWGNHAGLYPLLAGSYSNPTWITGLAWSKITGAPSFLTTNFANANLTFTGNRSHDAAGYSLRISNADFITLSGASNNQIDIDESDPNSITINGLSDANSKIHLVATGNIDHTSSKQHIFIDGTSALVEARFSKDSIAFPQIKNSVGLDSVLMVTASGKLVQVAKNSIGGSSYTGSKSIVLTALDFTLQNDSTTLVEDRVYAYSSTDATRGWKKTNVSNFTSLANKDLMWYNSSTGQWNNLTIASLKSELAIVMLINGAANIGSGAQVFKDTSSNKINLRSIVAGTGISVTENANDITIASTIPANADSTSARIRRGTFAQRPAVPDTGQVFWQTDRLSGQWNYDGVKWLFNGPANRYIYFTEWAGSLTGGFNTNAPTLSGSGATAIITGEQGIDDVMRFSTGTTSSGNTTVYFGQSPTITTNYDSIIVYSEYKIKIDSLGDASNDFEAFVGVPTSSSSYDYPLFGMLYSYNLNSGNFTTRTRDNNSAGITTKNTGVAVVAGTWYKIGIEIDGFARTIKFYINDVLVTTHSGADNIPFDGNTFTGGWGFIGVLKQAGSIPRFLRNDYVFSYIIKKKYD